MVMGYSVPATGNDYWIKFFTVQYHRMFHKSIANFNKNYYHLRVVNYNAFDMETSLKYYGFRKPLLLILPDVHCYLKKPVQTTLSSKALPMLLCWL